MPNYDLGTARGRIKVDSDTRGAKLADRALQAFERTVRALSGRMSAFEDHMNAMERELNQAAREFESTGGAARGYERGVRDADRASRDFSNGIVELHGRLKGLHRTTEQLLPPSLQLVRIWREFSKTDGGFVNLTRSIHRTGGTAQILSMITSRFIGMGAAIETVTGKQRKVIQFASGFRTFAFVGGVVAGAAAKMGLFEKTVGRLFRQTIEGDHALLGLRSTLQRFTDPIRRVIANLDRMALGTVQFIGGVALMRRGAQQLRQRFAALGAIIQGMPGWMKLATGAAIIFGKALEQILAKALVTVSNLLMDIAAAGKQLAGGFLAIPGGIAMIAAAVGTLKAIIVPLKDQFKDLFDAKTPEEMTAAIDALPDHLKPLGRVLRDIIPQWKELQTSLQRTGLGGADVQLRALSDRYLPAISRGSLMVANSWRMAKDQVVAFASQAQTVSDVQRIFMNTSQTMNNFKDSIRPALEGLRDLAAVGSDFLRDLSAGLPNIMQRFADWARINRENGNLMRWMQDAWRGTKDLVNGLKDAGKATWTLLTLFKDRSGEGSLDRFANAMERFNNAVQKSAAGGVLRDIGDAVRNMGTDKIKELWEIIKTLAGALQDLVPFVAQASEGIRDVMVPAIKAAVFIIRQVLDAFNEFGGGRIVGWILGIVGAWKLMGTVLGPLRNVIQIFIGAFSGFKGAQNLVLGLAGTLENFGGIGQRASNKLLGVGDSIAKWGTRLGIAGLAIGGLVMGIQSAQQEIEDWNRILADAGKHADEFSDKLTNAFLADRGLTGKTVMSTITEQVATMRGDLEAEAGKVPDVLDHLKELWFGGGQNFGAGMGPFSFSEGNEFNDMQAGAEKAAAAQKAFDRLKLSNQDLAAVAASSETVFRKQVDAIRASGEGGNEAADQLEKLHKVHAELEAEMRKAGPGAAMLAAGIQQIAQAGGDADTKLTGLKLALQGLGFDKTTQYENAIALAEAVNKIANEAATAADQSQPLTDIWGPNGELNAGFSANANNLFNLLSPAIEQFKRTASSGGDIAGSFKRITDQIPALAAAFTPVGGNVADTTAKIQNLIGELGGIPQVVSVLVQLDGKDRMTQDMAQIWAFAQANLGKGIGVPIFVQDPKAVETEIEKIYGDIFDSTDNALTLKVNVDPAGLGPLQQWMAQHGIQMPGGPPPAAPAQVPIAPAPAGRGPAPAAPPGPAAPAPHVAPPPADQAALDNANKTIGDLKRQIDELNAKPAKIQIDTGTLDEVKARLEEVRRIFNNGNIEFTIIAHGYDETTAVVNQVKDAVTKLIEEVGKIAPAFQAAFSQVQGILGAAQSQMKDSGHKMMSDLAQGIRDGAQEVLSAATESANVVAEVLVHRSPPKKGPLSGRNWVGYSGQTLSSDFAAGIVRGYTVAGKAASGLAGEVGGALGLPYRSGNFQSNPILGQLSSLMQFAQNAMGMFDKVSGIMLDAAKFVSDPFGKGTFFGQSTGAALGFKVDPKAREEQRKRAEDENYQAIGVTHGGSGKAPGPTEITGEVTVAGADWDAIAQKESGGVWDLAHGDRDSTGGLQIRQGTWEDFGGLSIAPQPYMASKADQIKIAEKILAKQGPQAWAGGKNFVAAKPGQTTAAGRGTSTAHVTGAAGLKPATANLLKVIEDRFPEIAEIGGVRSDSKPYHPSGRALDIMIPGQGGLNDPTTPEGKALGDRIHQFLMDNAEALGVDTSGTLWQQQDHYNHIHAQTLEGAQVDPNSVLSEIGDNTGQSVDQQAAILNSLRQQNGQLDEQIKIGQNPTSTDEQVASSLQLISSEIDKQSLNDTPAGRANVQALEGIKSSIAGDRGMVENQNPLDQASNLVSGVSSIAGSVFEVMNATIEAINATKNLADMTIRYPSNTEDIMQMIDDFQKYIALGAAVAGAVSAIAGAAGSMTGGMDMGATSAVGQVAGMIQAALEAINAGIDLAQEAWHIFGSYFGDFLGILAGGPGGSLQGNVRFLLDENAGQLFAYGADNPQDKRGHNVPGMIKNPEYTQGIGQVNVYGGPGSDPRDNTRDMMFQVRAAGFAGATNG